MNFSKSNLLLFILILLTGFLHNKYWNLEKLISSLICEVNISSKFLVTLVNFDLSNFSILKWLYILSKVSLPTLEYKYKPKVASLIKFLADKGEEITYK